MELEDVFTEFEKILHIYTYTYKCHWEGTMNKERIKSESKEKAMYRLKSLEQKKRDLSTDEGIMNLEWTKATFKCNTNSLPSQLPLDILP